jgi:Right handed beta helix region
MRLNKFLPSCVLVILLVLCSQACFSAKHLDDSLLAHSLPLAESCFAANATEQGLRGPSDQIFKGEMCGAITLLHVRTAVSCFAATGQYQPNCAPSESDSEYLSAKAGATSGKTGVTRSDAEGTLVFDSPILLDLAISLQNDAGSSGTVGATTTTSPDHLPSISASTVVAGSTNGTLHPTQCAAKAAAPWCSGSDLGAWVNAAGASCSWECNVEIDPGSFTQTTTIRIPIFNYQKSTITCSPGAHITYSGTGYWLDTFIQGGMSASGEQIAIRHCEVTGTAGGAGAVRLLPSNSPVVEDNHFTGFTNGDAVTVAGANHVTFRGNVFSYNKNAVRFYGVKCLTKTPYTCSSTQSGSTMGFAPNALKFEANEFAGNSQWAVLDDQTQGMQVQALNNQYSGNVFEGNGTAGSSYGAVAIDQSVAAVLHRNYFEGNPRNVVVGLTGCCNEIGTVIKDNYFTVGGQAPYTIELRYSVNSIVSGNTELGGGSTCFENSSYVTNDFFGPNTTTSAYAYCVGGSDGNSDTDTVVSQTRVVFQNPYASTFHWGGSTASYARGGWLNWNLSASGGETDNVNHRGTGAIGGFRWYDTHDSSAGTILATLDGKGNFGIVGSYQGLALKGPNGDQWLSDDGATGGWNFSSSASTRYGFRFWLGAPGSTSLGQIDPSGNWYVGSAGNVVYRCTEAGTLPVGALTINSGSCGSSADSGLRLK